MCTCLLLQLYKGLSALAGKFGVVFETFQPKIVWWQSLFWTNLSALETIHSYQAVASDNTCMLLMERIMALQQMTDKKNIFVYLVDFVQFFIPRANFVRGVFEGCLVRDKAFLKSRQTIRIC